MHDSIGSSLTAIKFSLENLLTRAKGGDFTPESLRLPIEMTQRAMDESRRMMTDLRPAMLDDLGIVTTVGWFCRQSRDVHPELGIDLRIGLVEEDVPEELKIVIFRVLQEAVSNISKYSRAGLAILSLAKTDGGIELTVRDNGTGFDVQDALSGNHGRKGMGLTSMKERTELSGGRFDIESVVGEGTHRPGFLGFPRDARPGIVFAAGEYPVTVENLRQPLDLMIIIISESNSFLLRKEPGPPLLPGSLFMP